VAALWRWTCWAEVASGCRRPARRRVVDRSRWRRCAVGRTVKTPSCWCS